MKKTRRETTGMCNTCTCFMCMSVPALIPDRFSDTADSNNAA